jgi:NADPH-dependent ferric siderophore reductase
MIVSEVEVRSVERLTPSFLRVALGGSVLSDFGVDGPLLDQRIKLLFPGPSGLPDLTAVAADPAGWYAAWRALPEPARGHLRTYTVRSLLGTGPATRVLVDFVVHPADPGPGSAWALAARPGDRVGLVGPRRGASFGGIEFDPGRAGRLLLAADETAVPAVAGILDGLAADAAGTAYLEVPGRDDVLPLAAPPGMRVVWLPREGAAHGERLCRAVLTLFGLDERAAGAGGEVVAGADTAEPVDLWETPTYSSSGEPLPADSLPGAGPAERAGGLYAWVAGEAGAVTRIRRHLVTRAGLDRRQVAFMGYWRRGVAIRS